MRVSIGADDLDDCFHAQIRIAVGQCLGPVLSEHLFHARQLSLTADRLEHVLLQRLTRICCAPLKPLVDFVGHMSDLDCRHKTILALDWRYQR